MEFRYQVRCARAQEGSPQLCGRREGGGIKRSGLPRRKDAEVGVRSERKEKGPIRVNYVRRLRS